MSLGTAQKRRQAVAVSSLILPLADGDTVVEDRSLLARVYSHITTAVSVVYGTITGGMVNGAISGGGQSGTLFGPGADGAIVGGSASGLVRSAKSTGTIRG